VKKMVQGVRLVRIIRSGGLKTGSPGLIEVAKREEKLLRNQTSRKYREKRPNELRKSQKAGEKAAIYRREET